MIGMVAVRGVGMRMPRVRVNGSHRSQRRGLRDWSQHREDVRFQFKCTQCGKCCTGRGGKVRLNEREIEDIARVKAVSTTEVKAQYLRASHTAEGNQWLLKQTPDDAQCVFLEGKKCSIYQESCPNRILVAVRFRIAARPTQCRTFPWWPQNLISDYDWHLAARDCEGITPTTAPVAAAASVPSTVYSFDDILPEAILHDIHRSGENFTYDELAEMLADLRDVDEEFVREYKSELFAKFSRRIVFRDDQVTVLDTFLASVAPTRCFFFNDRIHLIQSEVALAPSSNSSSEREETGDLEGGDAIDRNALVLDVHRAMCIPFAMLQQQRDSEKGDEKQLRVAVLGSGAASLPLFLLKHIKEIARLDAVEPSAKVNSIARKFFGLEEAELSDSRLKVHEAMGEAFILAQREQGAKYDVLAVDVESGESEYGVKAPPSSMLTPDFLTSVKQLLTANGVLVVNVIAETSAALEHTEQAFGHVFPGSSTRMVVQLPNNAVFYLFNDGEGSEKGQRVQADDDYTDKEQLIEVLSRDAFQAQRVRSPALLRSASEIRKL